MKVGRGHLENASDASEQERKVNWNRTCLEIIVVGKELVVGADARESFVGFWIKIKG